MKHTEKTVISITVIFLITKLDIKHVEGVFRTLGQTSRPNSFLKGYMISVNFYVSEVNMQHRIATPQHYDAIFTVETHNIIIQQQLC